ncbi:Mobile element protein [Candidatus Enterovibrio altilux]|uniref:Mobile element protein n=1 Tax=Candidatus Enterovibrio altilux TaxID=1927128 RepID=A0A291BC17_9GAMM|nr:Mobile element protein [Candidatus Enterovibrio luxaltus]
MVKCVFLMPLRGLQGLINSVFIPLLCPRYLCISKRAKMVDAAFKTKTERTIRDLSLDSTELNVYGEGEWKVKT